MLASPTKVLSLVIDIDNTFISPRLSGGDIFYVHGDGLTDLRNVCCCSLITTNWYRLLTYLRQKCSEYCVELDVHLICSKTGRVPDGIVDAAVTLLFPFLAPIPLIHDGNHHDICLPQRYFFCSYSCKSTKTYWIYNSLFFIAPAPHFTYFFSPFCRNLLPKIHMVCNNVYSPDITNSDLAEKDESQLLQSKLVRTNKAEVMLSIELQLKQCGFNPIGMILVDDKPNPNKEDVEQFSYKFVSAENSLDVGKCINEVFPNIRKTVGNIILQHCCNYGSFFPLK